MTTTQPPAERVERVRQLYRQAGVFEKASRLVDKHQQRAEAVAEQIEPAELRRLFRYLIDTVLERPEEEAVETDPAPPLAMIERIQIPS